MSKAEQFFKLVSKRGAKLHDFELRDYSVGLGGGEYAPGLKKGEDSVPLTIAQLIMKRISDETGLFSKVRSVIGKTSHREVIEIAAPGRAGFVKEGSKILEIDSTFTSVELESYKAAIRSVATNESLADVNFNLEAFINDDIAEKLKDLLEEVIVRGTKTQGINSADFRVSGLMDYAVASGASETVRLSNSSLNVVDLITAYYKMPEENRKQAVLLASPSFIHQMRAMEDNGGKLLLPNNNWNLNVTSFFGVPVVENKYLDDATRSGGVPAMFVVLDKAVIVNLRGDVNLTKAHEVKSQALEYKDVINFIASVRFDTQVLYHNAISAIKNNTPAPFVVKEEVEVVEEVADVEPVAVVEEVAEEAPKRGRGRKPKAE